MESISFENYKKFVRTLNYFQVGSTSNYTSYHKKINTLVLSKMPAYSPPSTPSPTVRPLVPPNVPGNQESDIPEEKSDIEEFYLQQQKRRKY